MRNLYYGDNLEVLRESIKDESVDLIYLDPPFNSKRDYNLLFKSPKGHASEAQTNAFVDSWYWGEQAEQEYRNIVHQKNTAVSEMMQALRRFLGENDMMAYLTMMCNRLLELHRVLKPTGSLYLHCDPTASHYLKIVLDGVFGNENFRTEISWKRQSAHNDAKQGRKQYGNIRDVIFFYTESDNWHWNQQYTAYTDEHLKTFYKYIEQGTNRRYGSSDITAPGGASPQKRNPYYEFLGVTRYWRYSKETMEKLYSEGRIMQSTPGSVPRYKRYLDEMPGTSLQNDWDDVKPVMGGEALGYPTQKPLSLLERIIQASSNEGDVVLDPFCGCGTAVHAAEKLNRKWIGIDITHLAINLINKRLKDAFPDIKINIEGTPKDLEGARNLSLLNKYQFQYWAGSLIDAQAFNNKKKGADGGIDGLIYFYDDDKEAKKIIVSIKGGENVSVAMIRDLGHVVEREKAVIGIFITLAQPTSPMKTEAVKAGYYVSKTTGNQYPKLQILTIEGLLNGTERAQHPQQGNNAVFKKARVEQTGKQEGLFK